MFVYKAALNSPALATAMATADNVIPMAANGQKDDAARKVAKDTTKVSSKFDRLNFVYNESHTANMSVAPPKPPNFVPLNISNHNSPHHQGIVI